MVIARRSVLCMSLLSVMALMAIPFGHARPQAEKQTAPAAPFVVEY